MVWSYPWFVVSVTLRFWRGSEPALDTVTVTDTLSPRVGSSGRSVRWMSALYAVSLTVSVVWLFSSNHSLVGVRYSWWKSRVYVPGSTPYGTG